MDAPAPALPDPHGTAPRTDDPRTDDPKADVARSRRRLAWRWGVAAAALLALLSVFTGGLFLYAAAVVGGLLLLAVAVAGTSLLGVEVRRSLSATEVPVGGVVEVTLELDNRKDWPALWLFYRDGVDPGLDLEGPAAGFESLGGGGRAKLEYRLHATRRGLFRVGPAVVEASGPFGLVRRYLVDERPAFVTVLPRVVEVGRGLPLGQRPVHEVPRRRSLFEDPSRFLGVRRYRPGDALRRVHWRATARSGVLQVKLFEPAVLEGMLLAVEMGAGADARERRPNEPPDPLAELAVTAAASLADFVLGGGQSVGLISNGADAAEGFPDDWQGGTFRRLDDALDAADRRRKIEEHRPLEVPPARGGWQRQRLLTALARLTPAPGPTLPELLHVELPRLPRSLVLAVLTPRLDGALAAVLGELRRSGFELAVFRVGGAAGGPGAAALPPGIPIYPLAGDADLRSLGGQRL